MQRLTQASFRSFIISFLCIWLVAWAIVLPAEAVTQIKIIDLSYHVCPPEIGKGAVTSGGTTRAADCYLVTGTAVNSTNKTLYDADVFGRVYDATGNPAIQNRSRLGSIDQVPPGKSPFEIRISVPAGQPEPLQLKQFKATGFSSSVKFRLPGR
jgi:hypothetical protein